MEKKLLLVKSVLQTCFFAMKNQRNIAALVGSIALISFFEFLTYDQKHFMYAPGANVLIFSIISLALAISLYQPSLKNKVFWWSCFGSIASAINITYQPDNWSILIYILSHFLVVGSIQSENNKNILYSLAQWFLMQFSSPFYTIKFLVDPSNWKSHSRKVIWKITKLVAIPLVIFGAFLAMYSFANPQFEKIFLTPMATFFTNLVDFNFGRIFIWMVGAMFVIPLMIPIQYKKVILNPAREQKHINRKRKAVKKLFKNLDLSNELRISTLTLIGLNLLIFFFNILDIVYVWISTTPRTASELSNYVHSGTNMVILSIVIGSAMILFFFRKNINFHPKSGLIKRLSFIWLAQNCFLAISTLQRNMLYVNEYGLTMKRLGVVVFISLVLIGLYFTYQKVAKKHTIKYFISRTLLATYIVLVGFSLVDHPRLIIAHAAFIQKDNIDIRYLKMLSRDHNFLIVRYADQLASKSGWKTQDLAKTKVNSYNNNWREFSVIDYINKNQAVISNNAEPNQDAKESLGENFVPFIEYAPEEQVEKDLEKMINQMNSNSSEIPETEKVQEEIFVKELVLE